MNSNPSRPRFSRRGALIGAGMLSLSACLSAPVLAQPNSRNVPAAEWTRILDAARREGKVVLYATMAPAVHDRIAAAFNAAYPGIKMEVVRVIGSAMTIKFEQERQNPGVAGGDAMITADVRWAMDAARKGYLRTPVGPNAASWPDAWMKSGQIVFLGVNPWVMNYNTNLVKTPINSYQDLLRPELSGKLASTSLVAEVVTIWYKWLDDTYPGYLERLASQNVKMYPASVAASNSTASGEVWANAFSVIPIDAALHAQKAPIRTVIPNPAYGFSYGGAVVSWAKNPNAALVAMDFLMSPRGQQAIVGNEESASPLPNIPGSLDMRKYNMQVLDWDKATPESIKTFEAKWNRLFGAR